MCCSCSSAAAEFYGVFPAHAAGSAVHSGQCAAQRSCAGVRRCHGLPFFRWHPPSAVHLCRAGSDLFARLPVAEGVGIALQMTDGTTRVLRMSEALERHLRQEWTPYLLATRRYQGGRSAAGAAVSGQQGSAHDLATGKISGRPHSGAAGRACRSGYADPDPRTVSGREMLDAVCMPVGIDPEDVLVLAGGLSMLDMVRASSQSTAAADAPAELRLAAQKVTLTDAAAGSAVEVLYRMVRDAENLA